MACLYKRRGQYWVSYYLKGKQCQKSLKTDNYKVAVSKKNKLEYEVSIGDLHLASEIPVAVFLEVFCKHLKKTRTFKSYKNDFSRLRIFFGPICESLKPYPSGVTRGTKKERTASDKYKKDHVRAELLEDITPEVINQFLTDRMEFNDWKPKTVNLMRQILHKLFAYAMKHHGFRSRDRCYPDGSTTLTRTNTPQGQIDTLSLDSGTTSLVEYAYLGGRVFSRAYNTTNPVTAQYNYDHYGRISSIDAGQSLVKFGYTYANKENNIEKKVFYHRDATSNTYNEYTYDDIDRLKQAKYLDDGDTTVDKLWETFNMDDLGNRGSVVTKDATQTETTENYTVNSLTNRYTDIGGVSLPDPQYDDAGNLTADHRDYTYAYDYENRIIKIEKPDGPDDGSDPDPVAEFAYDTQGRRIMVYDAVLDLETRFYYSDNWQVLAEYNGSGTQQAYYVYGNYIDEVLLMHRNAADYYYLHDHLYSPVALLSSAGTVVERYEYDAYGQMTRLNANFTAFSGTEAGNPYYFTGRRLDSLDSGDLEPMHYRHRAYDTHTGRFMQQDPLGTQPVAKAEINPFDPTIQYTDGLNLMTYSLVDPVNKSDYWGLYLPPMPPPQLPPPSKEITQKEFEKWYENEKQKGKWWIEVGLPKCPRKLCMEDGKPQKPKGPDAGKWKKPGKPEGIGAEERLHPDIIFSMRSKTISGHSNQCTYDIDGNLYLKPPKAGTVDWGAPPWATHILEDIYPLHSAVFLDHGIDMAIMTGQKTPLELGKYMNMYYEMRPLYAEGN